MRTGAPAPFLARCAIALAVCLGGGTSLAAATVGNVYTLPPASTHADPGYTANQTGADVTITNPASTTALLKAIERVWQPSATW